MAGPTKITTRAGKRFTIELDSNPTTGYVWTPEFDNVRIQRVDHELKPQTDNVGAASREKFVFEAKSRGVTEVVMFLKRPWEKKALEERRFHITVE